MKKSEALKALGLSDGATDDEVKRIHRKLVIAHHPDNFPLDSQQRIDAEEKTKLLNESRDVLLNRSWTPEFDPRRDASPYVNPYANPYGQPTTRQGQESSGDPFGEWPFGQGQGNSWVWTSWDGDRTGGSAADDTFDPFAPFRTTEPQKTPAEVLAETTRDLKSEALVVTVKLAVLAVAILLGSFATGLFFYVMTSIIYGLWKRFGSCLIGLIVPLALVSAPFIFIIAPKQGAVTMGLGLAFVVAVLFDLTNIRDRIRSFRVAKQRAAQAGKSA